MVSKSHLCPDDKLMENIFSQISIPAMPKSPGHIRDHHGESPVASGPVIPHGAKHSLYQKS